MKKRRMLAFVLCMAMLFGDFTNTYASTLPDSPVVITDVTADETDVVGTEENENMVSTENMEVVTTTESGDTTEVIEAAESEEADTETTEIVGTEVDETEVTETEAENTETVEGTLETEESEDTELVTEEIEVDTELASEIVLEVPEERENVKSGVDNVYINMGEDAISDGTIETFAEAKTAIDEYLTLEENAGASGEIHISLNADMEYAGSDLLFEYESIRFILHPNGHTVSVTDDAVMSVEIHGSIPDGEVVASNGGIFDVVSGKTLTLLPNESMLDGSTYTNIFDITIQFDENAQAGALVVGEQYADEGLSIKTVSLGNVKILNAYDVTLQGMVDVNYSDGNSETKDLVVRNELRIENHNDEEADIYQSAWLNVDAQCKNLAWNGNGTVMDMEVTDTLNTFAKRDMEVRGCLSINDMYVDVDDAEVWDCFGIHKVTILDGDNKNAFVSEAEVVISGGIGTVNGQEYTTRFMKKNIIQKSATDEGGNTYFDEQHFDGIAFANGEVVATLGENAAVDTAKIRLEQWENNKEMLVERTSGQLVAKNAVVQVALWDSEQEENINATKYTSWEAAMMGIVTDFADMEGQYNILVFDDVTLEQNAVFPEYVKHVCMDTMERRIDNEEGGYHEVVCVDFDFNGYSFYGNMDVDWSEAIYMKNSNTNALSHVELNTSNPEEYQPTFRWNGIEIEKRFVDTDGKTIARNNGKAVMLDSQVDIYVYNGSVELQSPNDSQDALYQIMAKIEADRIEVRSSNWIVSNLKLNASRGQSFLGEHAFLMVEWTTEVIADTGFEVRGDLTLRDVKVKKNSQYPYAGFWLNLVTGYDRDNDNAKLYQGTVLLNGTVTSEIAGDSTIRFQKAEVYHYIAGDEEGNTWEEQEFIGNTPFVSGEAIIKVMKPVAEVPTELFSAYSDGMNYTIRRSGYDLKVYAPVVSVNYYNEATNTGINRTYLSLEEAFTNMGTDFNKAEGTYTINLLEDVTLSTNLTVPSFVTELRMQSKWEWVDHYDEDGNRVEIYDDQGNFMGYKGHDKVYRRTLDMNGKTITSAVPVHIIEGLTLVSNVATAGKLVVNAKTGDGYDQWAAVAFDQVTYTDIELLDKKGNYIDRNEEYECVFAENVNVSAPNGVVNLWAQWGNYQLHSNVDAMQMSVRGNWQVDSAVLSHLGVQSGWYDEKTDEGEAEGNIVFDKLSLKNNGCYIGGVCQVNGNVDLNTTTLFIENYFSAKTINNTKSQILVDGVLEVDEITMTAGGLCIGGRADVGSITVKSAYANEANGQYTIQNDGFLFADVLDMSAGTFYNAGNATITEIKNIKDFYNAAIPLPGDVGGATFVCDTFNQNSAGKSYLEERSLWIINENATIYNPVIGAGHVGEEDAATIYRMPNATIAIEGKVTRDYEWLYANFGVLSLEGEEDIENKESAVRVDFVELLDNEGNFMGACLTFLDAEDNEIYSITSHFPVKNFDKGEALFTTKMKEFPVEAIWTHQNEEAPYYQPYQMNGAVRMGSDWIIIRSVIEEERENEYYYNEEVLKTFTKWADAEAYIATLANPNVSYMIEICEDLDIQNTLKLPTKAVKVIVRGGSEEQIKLTYTGDITLSTDTIFENLILEAVDKNGEAYASTVTTKGHDLVLARTEAHFASITGTNKSNIELYDGSNIVVDKAVKTLDQIGLYDSTLTVGEALTAKDAAVSAVSQLSGNNAVLTAVNGSIAFTSDVWLAGTVVEAATKMNFVDIYSLDDGNRFIYGGNEAGNILTITGNVYGAYVEDENFGAYVGDFGVISVEGGYQIAGEEDTPETYIRGSAIDLRVEALANQEGGYKEGELLVNAAKVPASWFVVGSKYDEESGARTGFTSLTYKSGTEICYGKGADANFVLQMWDYSVAEDGDLTVHGSYETLEEAFAEIERIGDKYGEYYILMNEDMDDEKIVSTLATPKNASYISIYSVGDAKTVYYDKELKLNSSLAFDNIILAPQTEANKITLADYQLHLVGGTKLEDGKKIGSITGSGTQKNSYFGIANTVIEVTGDVTGIGWVEIDESKLVVNGKVTIGNIAGYTFDEMDATLVGTAKVTRKDGIVTKVEPQITIEGIYSGGVTIELQEKVVAADKSVSYVALNFDEMTNLLDEGIQLAKATNATSMDVWVSAANTANVECPVSKKNGYFVFQNKDNISMALVYFLNEEEGIYAETHVATFEDAVKEINNLKTKRDYYMCISGSTGSPDAPANLKMPSANAISNLYISAYDDNYDDEELPRATIYYTGNITLTSDVFLGDVDFKQVAKDGTVYGVDDYPAQVSVSTGGNDLTIVGDVTFNTPVKLDGGRKGNLYLNGYTETLTNELEAYFSGSVVNFAKVEIENGLSLTDYVTISNGNEKYTAPILSATEIYVADNAWLELDAANLDAKLTLTELCVDSDASISVVGSATVKNTSMYGMSRFGTTGKLALTNVTFEEDSVPLLGSVGGDFTISGTLTSYAEESVLVTAQKVGKTVGSYLNISGKVEATHPIGVLVYDENGVTDLENGEALLTAKNATVDMFVPAVMGDDDSVGGRNPYGMVVDGVADKTGYIFAKEGNDIRVYYGDNIEVALCEGTDGSTDLRNADVLGYYTSFEKAVEAIDKGEKGKSYTMLLLNEDINSATAPKDLKLPKNATEIKIASVSGGEKCNIYFTGNLTLNAPVTFYRVNFCPLTKKNEATTFDIKTGAYDLTLSSIAIGDGAEGHEAMVLNNIIGDKRQITTLNTDGLVIQGNVTDSGELRVPLNAEVKGNVKVDKVQMTRGGKKLIVGGTFEAGHLVLGSSTTVKGEKAITIGTISNSANGGSSSPKIEYGVDEKTGAPNLTIKGVASGTNPLPIALNLISEGKTEADYVLQGFALPVNQKLATIKVADQSAFKMQLNGTEITQSVELLRANEGVYITDGNSGARMYNVILKEVRADGYEGETKYIDFTQAVTAINTIANPETEYTLLVGGVGLPLDDTNVLDKSDFGALTLPKANAAASIKIAGDVEEASDEKVELSYTGGISYSGKLILEDILLNPVDTKGKSTDTDISVTKDKQGVAELELNNVTTRADVKWATDKTVATGFVGKISGTKDVTTVTLTNTDLLVKKAISNVDVLTLSNTQLITCDTVTVNDVIILDTDTASTWDALGKTTITTLDTTEQADGAYIASKQTAKTLVPMLTVNGEVEGESVWKVYAADATAGNMKEVATYEDVSLAVAPKASADSFIAYPFADDEVANDEGITNIIWYKDTKNAVKNGNKDNMNVMITKDDAEVTYAKSFDEAVTLIENIADTDAWYQVELLTTGYVKTTKGGTEYGALTLPKKAQRVEISGQVDGSGNPTTILAYTGEMKVDANVIFNNILLTEGSVNKEKEFVPTYSISPEVSGKYVSLNFGGNAATLENPNEVSETDLVFTAVNAAKAAIGVADRNVRVNGAVTSDNIVLEGVSTMTVAGDITVSNELYITDCSALGSESGKIKIDTVCVMNNELAAIYEAVLSGTSTITITDITSKSVYEEDETLQIYTSYTTTKNATTVPISQLEIKGSIEKAEVDVVTQLFEYGTGYYELAEEDVQELMITDTSKKLEKDQKLVTIPVASADAVNILVYNGTFWEELPEEYNLVKQDGGLYVTTVDPMLYVYGVDRSGEQAYGAYFLDWDQAVKEIDKINDVEDCYTMQLLRNVGEENGELTPIKNLTLPSKAMRVFVRGGNIFFTGKTISVKCNTEFHDTGLMAVKQMKKNKDTWYESTTFDMNIGKNYVLMDNLISYVDTYNEDDWTGYYESLPGTVSGAKNGSLSINSEFVPGENNDGKLLAYASKISGVGTVSVYGNIVRVEKGVTGVENLNIEAGAEFLAGDGDVSVKNMAVTESVIFAKNVTVSGTTELTSAAVIAGTEKVGDGKCKLNNVVLHDKNSVINAKQDKSGKTLIDISGTVSGDFGDDVKDVLAIMLRYNDSSYPAQLYDGMTLLNATKADAEWFVPCYTTRSEEPLYDEEGNPLVDDQNNPIYEVYTGMGWEREGYGLYKQGKEIRYGKIEQVEGM